MKWEEPVYTMYAKFCEILVSRKFIAMIIVIVLTINGHLSEETLKYTVISFIGIQGLLDLKKPTIKIVKDEINK